MMCDIIAERAWTGLVFTPLNCLAEDWLRHNLPSESFTVRGADAASVVVEKAEYSGYSVEIH